MCFSLWASSVFPACLCALAESCRGVTAVGKLPSGPSYTGKPLPDPTHRQTPSNCNSPPSSSHPQPSFFSPLLWLQFPLCDWLDSCSLTTPPHWDRLLAAPFPVWPRARLSGMWSPIELLWQLLCHCNRLQVPCCPLSPTPQLSAVVQRKHSELNYMLRCVASRMPGIKSTETSHQAETDCGQNKGSHWSKCKHHNSIMSQEYMNNIKTYILST